MTALSKALTRDSFIREGVNPARDVFLLACTLGDDQEAQESRVLVVRGEEVLSLDIAGESAVSIDADAGGRGYVLGDSGSVVHFDWLTPSSSAELERSVRRIENRAVEEYGPLRRLRLLGSDVVCVGSVGQVYRLDGEGFVVLPPLLIDGADVTIEDLSGSSVTDFTVASLDGFVAHCDGEAWHEVYRSSQSGLNAICQLQGGRYAVAGNNDTLVVGAGDEWQLKSLPDQERDYTGIAAQGDSLYLAHLDGIDVFANGGLHALKIPRRIRNEFVVLRSGPNGVGSFAGRSVGLIADGEWRVLA